MAKHEFITVLLLAISVSLGASADETGKTSRLEEFLYHIFRWLIMLDKLSNL